MRLCLPHIKRDFSNVDYGGFFGFPMVLRTVSWGRCNIKVRYVCYHNCVMQPWVMYPILKQVGRKSKKAVCPELSSTNSRARNWVSIPSPLSFSCLTQFCLGLSYLSHLCQFVFKSERWTKILILVFPASSRLGLDHHWHSAPTYQFSSVQRLLLWWPLEKCAICSLKPHNWAVS